VPRFFFCFFLSICIAAFQYSVDLAVAFDEVDEHHFKEKKMAAHTWIDLFLRVYAIMYNEMYLIQLSDDTPSIIQNRIHL